MKILRSLALLLIPFSLSLLAATPSPSALKMHTTEDAFKGAVMGAALGDALGRVTEFIESTEKIKKAYGSAGVTSFRSFKEKDWVTDPRTKQKIAAYTDDTVMALLVLKTATQDLTQSAECPYAACIPSNCFPNVLALEFVKLFGPDNYTHDPLYAIRAHGPTNIHACEELAEWAERKQELSFSWWLRGKRKIDFMMKKDETAAFEGGCGSVMRAWPVGLIYWNREEMIPQRSYDQSILTHRHPMAIIASTASALGIAHAVRMGPDGSKESPEEIIQAMIKGAQEADEMEQLYKTSAKKILNLSDFSPSLVAEDKLLTSDMIRYAMYMAKNGEKPEKVLGTHNDKQENYRSPDGFLLGWAADEALAAAVYIFMRHPDNIQAALTEAVNTPGDSDSIATLVGALVGARIGFNVMQSAYQWNKLENYKGLQEAATAGFKAAHLQPKKALTDYVDHKK